MAVSLPEDIEKEILLKLPVESLVGFKLVSKSWYSLISNRQFIKLHLRQSVESNKDHLFVLYNWTNYEHVIKPISYFYESTAKPSNNLFQGHPYLKNFLILCSCDGLLLIRKIFRSGTVMIWNPATRESRKLPEFGDSTANLFHNYGLGYDWSTDDYKVIRCPSDKRFLMVFSLKSNSWRKVECFNYKMYSRVAVHVNGVVYWLVHSPNDPNNLMKVVGFKLAEEKILELPLPDGDKGIKALGDLKGRLCLLESFYESIMFPTLNVWVIKEDGDEAAAADSWTKFITLPQLPIHDDWPHFLICSGIFCINNHAVFITRSVKVNSEALVFDLEKHKLIDVHKFHNPPEAEAVRVFPFFQSLVSPK